jgi:hypothetical protein
MNGRAVAVTGWRLHFAFLGRKAEMCGGRTQRNGCRAGFTEGGPEAQLKRRIPGWEGVIKYDY